MLFYSAQSYNLIMSMIFYLHKITKLTQINKMLPHNLNQLKLRDKVHFVTDQHQFGNILGKFTTKVKVFKTKSDYTTTTFKNKTTITLDSPEADFQCVAQTGETRRHRLYATRSRLTSMQFPARRKLSRLSCSMVGKPQRYRDVSGRHIQGRDGCWKG